MTAGRPKTEIDRKQFENLCNIQCTLEEIAGWFRCSDSTIKRWCKETYGENFERVYKKYSKDGRISLRRYQFQLAKKSATMAIWLGKQMLGQTDKQDASGADYQDDGFTSAVKRSAKGVWDDENNS
jgi:AraC-like DNA-binding protein